MAEKVVKARRTGNQFYDCALVIACYSNGKEVIGGKMS